VQPHIPGIFHIVAPTRVITKLIGILETAVLIHVFGDEFRYVMWVDFHNIPHRKKGC
jgi:hypothetical protein